MGSRHAYKFQLLTSCVSCSAFLVCDRIGRIWATRQLCLLWIVGIAIFMGNGGHLGAVYAGRFIAGLGVGQTVVVAPVYLAEIVSPTRVDDIILALTWSIRHLLRFVVYVPVPLLALFIWALCLPILQTTAARSISAILLTTDGYV